MKPMLLACALVFASAARGDTLNFTYSGSQINFQEVCIFGCQNIEVSVVTTTASGSITYNGGAFGSSQNVGLSDVTNFTMTLTDVLNPKVGPLPCTFTSFCSVETTTFTYGTNDLTQFFAGGPFGSDGVPSGLIFQTDLASGTSSPDGFQTQESLGLTGPLNTPNNALTVLDMGNLVISGVVVDQPNVPEPSSLLLFGTGLIGGIGAMRRRFPK